MPYNFPEISAILITKNEEKNILRCLASLRWAKEVVMVDSGSEDRTLELARQYENVKIIQSEWLGYSATKRLAVQHTKCQWVFWIDADEEVTPALEKEMKQLFAEKTPEKIAYDIPRLSSFLGEWVYHTGWYPGRVLRLFDKTTCDFNDKILHEGVEIPEGAEVGHLKGDLLHYSYTSLYQYFYKMNFYGKYGAEELMRKGKPLRFSKIVLSPLAMFFKLYFLQKGFKDGKTGFIIALGSAFSQFIKYVNFYYLKTKGSVEELEAPSKI